MRKASWTDNCAVSLRVVLFLWAVYILNFLLPVDLRAYGIRPRYLPGLWGILACPFLHANWAHITANSTALFLLLTLALTYSRRLTYAALLGSGLLGGLAVWLLGESGTVHIGASGVIFGLIGFLIAAGFFRREWRALLYSIVVFLLYGGALTLLMERTPGVSWISHVGGFCAGVLSAWWTRKTKR